MEWNCWKQQLTDHWKAPLLPLCLHWGFQCLPAAISNSPLLNREAEAKLETHLLHRLLTTCPASYCLYEILFQDSQINISQTPTFTAAVKLRTKLRRTHITNTVMGKSSRKCEHLEQNRAQSGHVDTRYSCGWMSSVPTSELSVPFLGQKSDCWSSRTQISEQGWEESLALRDPPLQQ